MKIRTDFVTNSSSCSFVSYGASDSKLCKFLYDRLIKIGETPDKDGNFIWRGGRPASAIALGPDDLSGYISFPWGGGFYLDDYEGEGNHYDDFRFGTSLETVAEYLKDEEAKKKFQEILSEEGAAGKDWDSIVSDLSDQDYEECGAGEYSDNLDFWDAARVLTDVDPEEFDEDEEDEDEDEESKYRWHLCSRLFALLKESECDDKHITKRDNSIFINFSPDGYEDDDRLDLREDRMYLISYCGYTREEAESDSESAKEMLVSILSEYIDFDSLAEGYEAESDDEESIESIDDIESVLEDLLQQDIQEDKISAYLELNGTDNYPPF